MKPTDERLAELARLLSATTDEEIDCEEMLHRVSAYLRAAEKGSELNAELQQVAQHLKICPECREEFEALIKAEGLDPADLERE